MKKEIRIFLIYLHLTIMSYTGKINPEGYCAIYQLLEDYPQFEDIKAENEKIFKWLEELK